VVFKFKYLLLPFILLSIIFSILFAAEVDFNTLILADNIDQYEGLKIKEIKTRGNLVLTDEQIVEAFPIKVGEEFSKDIINDAIRILFATDSYDRIAIDTEVENNEIILTIVIDERPIIKDINFIGNKKVNRGDLLGNVRPFLEIGNTYLPQNLNNAVNSIILIIKIKAI
jgi:outer membrane protein insertion porin family